MMSLVYIVWMYAILFGIIGTLRGWVKELLVAFSLILALTLNHVLRKYIPMVAQLPADSTALFWIMSSIVMALIFFGYQTVAFVPHLQSKATRERLQDALFGTIVGALNGYLISGTILYYIFQTKYQVLSNIIQVPTGAAADTIKTMMTLMPPQMLGEPGIYFALILCFIFVIVVYI